MTIRPLSILRKRPAQCTILVFLTILIIVYNHRTKFSKDDDDISGLPSKSRLVRDNDRAETVSSNQISDITNEEVVESLKLRIEDLKRIKSSMRDEVQGLYEHRVKLLNEASSIVAKNERLVQMIDKNKNQIKQLALDLQATKRRKLEMNCDQDRLTPLVLNPLRSEPADEYVTEAEAATIKTKAMLNYTRCPLTRNFKFFLLQPKTGASMSERMSLLAESLAQHGSRTMQPDEACAVIDLNDHTQTRLSHGLSNVVQFKYDDTNGNNKRPTDDATMVASSKFEANNYKHGHDIILPSIWQPANMFNSLIGSMPMLSPPERKYLASYFGPNRPMDSGEALRPLEKILEVIHKNAIDDLFLFVYNCGSETNKPCYQEKEKMLEMSIFTLVLPGERLVDEHNSVIVQQALARGTIPVVVGSEQVRLPFDEVIDWRRASIMIPAARIGELHFIMSTYGSSDLYQLKHFGRHIYTKYLATAKQIVDTTLAIVSIQRFNYPMNAIRKVRTDLYAESGSLKLDTNCTTSVCKESTANSVEFLVNSEILGPREPPVKSTEYTRNYSLILNSAYDIWNEPMMSPFEMQPSLPSEPLAPSEFKFLAPDQGYRPIAGGLGGSGDEFSRDLGGDQPYEQFTIVVLTYERVQMLMKTMERLKGTPYVNKIIVVWNSVKHRPPSDLVWPDTGFPIEVVRVERNSLNNRFLPFDSIQTDAILSIDDDSPLRPDEVVFAFRVWREARDRIVGFPGRFHAWDAQLGSWTYNSNHSCELSMVLTGGAFFHRYYAHAYTFAMPDAVRTIVDRFMNCEDIAMNFLVAHLTRKPPIKVTSRWTFHCSGCQNSLSDDDSHFRERHECLNMFASIFGYMPLLSTQRRSDSVLFKTRLPHDKHKCFKFV